MVYNSQNWAKIFTGLTEALTYIVASTQGIRMN
jgi:hypothetical protein